MKNMALYTSGVIFFVAGVAHWIRFFEQWDLIVGNLHFPLTVSFMAGIGLMALAVWMFYSGSIKQ